MADKNQKNSTQAKTGINPVTAVVVGAAIAAGAAVAGAVAMNNKQNRDKVNKALDTVKNQADQKINQGKKALNTAKNQADQKISQGKSEVKKVVDKALS